MWKNKLNASTCSQISSAIVIQHARTHTHIPYLKIYVGLVGLVTLYGERSKLEALLQQSLGRGNETRHRHGNPQKIQTPFPVVTIHVCRTIKIWSLTPRIMMTSWSFNFITLCVNCLSPVFCNSDQPSQFTIIWAGLSNMTKISYPNMDNFLSR